MDINTIFVPNKVSFGKKKGFKYFTVDKNTKKMRPLCIYLPKMRAYRKDFDETKYNLFLIKDDELFKNTIKFGKTLKITSKKNLIENQFIMNRI